MAPTRRRRKLLVLDTVVTRRCRVRLCVLRGGGAPSGTSVHTGSMPSSSPPSPLRRATACPTGTVATKRRQASRRPPRGARSVLLLARRMYPSKFRHAIVFTVRSTCERVTLDVAHGMRREPHSRYWRAAPDSRVGTSWRSKDADLCVLSWTHTIPFHHRNSNPTRTPTPTIGSIHRHLR